MRSLLPLLLLFASLGSAFAQSPLPSNEVLFRYQYNVGDQFRYEGFLYQEASMNNKIVEKAESFSTVSARVTAKKEEWATLENSYRQSAKNTGGMSRLVLLEDSRYQQNELGAYLISMNYMFPAVRSVPSFPKTPVKIGGKWQAQAEEKFDLSWLNAGKVASILKVSYVYEGMAKKDGKDYHKIKLTYSPNIDKGTVSVRGKVEQTIYWDNERGNIAFYDDEFNFQFSSGGNVYTYTGISNGKRVDAPKAGREESWEENLKTQIANSGLKNVDVKRDRTGVKLILEDIYFEPESSDITSSEAGKLDKIAQILKDYPIYTLLIEGHTANSGSVESQDMLSDERAYRVGEYLQYKGFKGQAPLLFKGWGSTKPLSKGTKPEDVARNRRVEITLLEN